MRNIMVATDGSEGADREVDVAAELAKAFEGKLFIVTVAGNLSGEETRELAHIERNIGNALEALSMQILTTAEKRAQRLGVRHIQLQIGWGMRHDRSSSSPRARAPIRLSLAGAVAADWPAYCLAACRRKLQAWLPLRWSSSRN